MDIEFARVMDQNPGRVVMALRDDEGRFLDAATVLADGSPLFSQVDDARYRWIPLGIPFPEDPIAQASAACEVFTSPNVRVDLHMCSQGIYGCHVAALNTVLANVPHGRYGVDDVHDANPLAIQEKVRSWGENATLTDDQQFWLLASVMSRHRELRTRPSLEWWNSYKPTVWI